MINIFKSPQIQENISEKDLVNKTNIISDIVIEKINKLIENKCENKILEKIELLKELWRKAYCKANTLEEKEEKFKIIFVNLEKLLNNLNYFKVYNSDSIIWKTWEDYKNIDSLKNIVSIWWENNIEWANCNSWNLFIMENIKYITNNDSNIRYSLTIRKSDNHWMLYFTLNNKVFLYHLAKNHQLKIKEKIVSSEEYIYPNSIFNYYKNNDLTHLEWIKKHLFNYSIWQNNFKLYKKNWKIYIRINMWNKIKYIDIPWFKTITKKIYKFLKKRKKIISKKNINNILDLKESINKKVDSEEYKFILKALENINKEKLDNFFK